MAHRATNTTSSQPAWRIGPANPTVTQANRTRATAASTTPRLTGRVPRTDPSKRRAVRATPTVPTAAPSHWWATTISPRTTTDRMTVSPPYAATEGLTTETGPMASPANMAT